MATARFALARELCKAIQRDDESLTELLLSQGANPNTPLPDGVSPFHIAVGAKSIEYTKLMLQFNGNPNVRCSEGLTPLHVAAMWGKYEELQMLIYNGGDPFICEEEGRNAYDLAEEYGDVRCIELLKDYKEWDTGVQEDASPRYSLLPVSGCSSQDATDSLRKNHTWDLQTPPNTISSNSSSPALGYSCSPTNQRPSSSLSNESSANRRYTSSSSAGTNIANSKSYSSDISSFTDIDEDIAFNFAKSLNLLSDSFTSDKRLSRDTASSELDVNELDLGMYNSQQSDDNLSNISGATYVISRGSPKPGLPRLNSSGSSSSSLGQDCRLSLGSDRSSQSVNMDNAHRCSGTVSDLYDLVHGEACDFEKWGYGNSHGWISDDVCRGEIQDCCDSWNQNVDVVRNSKRHSDPDEHSCSDETHHEESRTSQRSNSKTVLSSSLLSGNDVRHELPNLSISTLASTLSEDSAQGLDVTSPDHPLIYMKSSTSSSEDDDSKLEKTILFCGAISEEDEDAFDSDDDEVEKTHKECDSTCLSSFSSDKSNSTNEEFYSAEEQPSEEGGGSLNDTEILSDESASPVRHCPDTLILEDSQHRKGLCRVANKHVLTLILDDSQTQSPRLSIHDTEKVCPDTLILNDSQTQSSELLVQQSEQACPDTLILNESQTPCVEHSQSDGHTERNRYSLSKQSCPDTLILEDSGTEPLHVSQRHVKTQSIDRNTQPDTLILDSSQESQSIKDRLRSSRKVKKRYSALYNVSDLVTSDDTSTEFSLDHRDRYSERSAGDAQTCLSSGDSQTPESVDHTIEYIYKDTDIGATLIERRCPSSCNSSQSGTKSVNSSLESSSDETIIYDWQQYQTDAFSDTDSDSQVIEIPPQVRTLSNRDLRGELKSFGESPGPINSTTRNVYLGLLTKLKKDPSRPKVTVDNQSSSGFILELHQCLCQNQAIPNLQDDEDKLAAQFDQPDPQRKWREGTLKSSFNYLLLDPRVTRNLPVRYHHGLSEMDAFSMFVSAIFYVGKGKRARPYAHFYEALEQISNPRLRPSEKVQHILDIWQLGLGVVSLHCFQSVIPVEAYTREACMVEALGLSRLTNAKKGDYYGIAATWSASKKRKMGIHLLGKAFKIFLIEGERQIRPADIRVGQ
ncbi:LOW QUALITY PROTEIN: uncharacterized protein [Ptychodera flava]|uniref:LOW QUALITY PROTEIN: uncharacterized protein n=1 Tax=Ptychodera flava TaxID=63121 RepID=UPI00396A272B